MIDSSRVGVKLPVVGKDSGAIEGVALSVAEGVAVIVGLGLELAEALGVGVGLDLGVGLDEADGDATKAGISPACTTKFLVSVLVIPEASSQEIVME